MNPLYLPYILPVQLRSQLIIPPAWPGRGGGGRPLSALLEAAPLPWASGVGVLRVGVAGSEAFRIENKRKKHLS